MNSVDLEIQVAGPIQNLGMLYYFEPGTKEIGNGLGLNVVQFYGIGRGGVLGDVSNDDVGEAFWFFHSNAIAGMYGSARAKAEPSEAARAHLQAAYAFADRTFGAIDSATLGAYADAARRVIDAVPAGQYALFDGYRAFDVPSEPVHAAYLATILLRELRGGVHITTTRKVGLAANEACYAQDAGIFKMHGYTDDDTPAETVETARKLAEAEELTTATMAGYLDVLDDDGRAALAAGVAAMSDALKAGAAT